MTSWNTRLDDGQGPLYLALADAIERDVTSGVLAPGERLPTHRDLADALGVNVSTVTRAYREAEKRGLLSATVGRGTFVTSDAMVSASMVSFEPQAAGTIEMGLINPLEHLDPDLNEGLKKLSRQQDTAPLLRYCDPRGMPRHREIGASWAARYGMPASADDTLVCSGAQHALTCCLSGLFTAGDRIAVEHLTYPGLKTLAAMLGIRLVPIAMDRQGMLPHALDTACRRDRIKGVYLMSGMQNPTTSSMDADRAKTLAELAERHDLTIIEDDAYKLTHPDSSAPVLAHAPGQGVYVAGISKPMAAGLRVAFMVAPQRLRKPLAQAILNSVWTTAPLNAELIRIWIQDGTADSTLAAKLAEARERQRMVTRTLRRHAIHGTESGFYIWMELPDGWSGKGFELAAAKRGVSVFGAERFSVGEAVAPAAVRISLTGPASKEELLSGLGIISELLDSNPG